MTEKYKIYIPEEMKSRLANDAELFGFLKKDGSVNLNAFLKELLVNYFDRYRERKDQLLNTILSDLNAFSSISKEDAAAIADKIINTYMKSTETKDTHSCAVTLTVSRRSANVMQAIENNMLAEVSLSRYLNDLFSSYLSIPRSRRERIIFQDVFDDLSTAINNNSVTTFSTTTAPDHVFTVRPYLIAASKEEQCNYILCTDNETGLSRSFRISRIRALYLTGEKFSYDEKIRSELQKIAIRSPESATRNVDAEVRLTDRGIQKFRVILKNRPDVLRKDGNTYYFNWPKFQLEEYFKRFGEDAVIVSPEECRESMKIFYDKATEVYQKPL